VRTDWSGKRVTIMGLGLFGGGVASAQYFADRGATVLVTDKRTRDELEASILEVDGVNVSFRLGGHEIGDFTDADLVVANPAVPPDDAFLDAARRAGVTVDAELNLFFRECAAPIVGVTGSNGKSTTAALIAHILTTAGRTCHLGGNIGRSLLGEVETIGEDDIVVLEISSFQLEYLGTERLSPHVAVVLNVRPNHLDRHGTMTAYAAVKREIVAHQSSEDVAVLNCDDELVSAMTEATPAETFYFSMHAPVKQGAWVEGDTVRLRIRGEDATVRGLERVKLPGRHNRENICAAVAVAGALDVPLNAIEDAIGSFEPLPHRQQKVTEREGVTWVNDSIATNPDSVAAALACYEGGVILIAGGSPKNIPYDAMIDAVVNKVKLLLLIGRTGPEIETAVRATSAEPPEIIQAETLERAVEVARERATPGDVVLLSPACASFDQFRNFRERGERFIELVLDA